MRRLVTGMAAVGFVLVACSLAAAQSQADLQAKVESLEKQVALLQAKSATGTGDVKMEETRRISREMSTDAAKYSDEFKIVWDDGVWFKSGDKFALHVGGQVLNDWFWVSANALENDNPQLGQGFGAPVGWRGNSDVDLQSGVAFRSARLLVEGTLYKYVDFKFEFDGSSYGVSLKDAYMELTQIPWVGNVRVGQFREPFGLEEQSTLKDLTFMEPALGTAVFAPGYSPGLMLHNSVLDGRMTWAVGVFRHGLLGNADDASPWDLADNWGGMAVYSEQGYALTTRVTGLPYYAENGAKLVHVGAAYSYRKANDEHSGGNYAEYIAFPEAMTEYPLLDAFVTEAENVNLVGIEAATVLGPFSFQTEYIGNYIDRDNYGLSNVCYGAYYAQASCFVTPGDHRAYDQKAGAFTRVRPQKNFREDNGWGAVELATRLSYVDLDEEGLGDYTADSRGELLDWTLGVNWYLNPNVRVSANYIRACPDRLDTANAVDIFMMRFQFDF